MKKSELRQLIREEISKVLKESPNVRSSLKKDDIVLYDGDRYIIIDRTDDDITLRPLRNPYGGSYHSSPMSYPTFKTNINDTKLSFLSN